MIGEIERLLDQRIEIDVLALAAAAARMQQHALDDAVGPAPVLGNLGQVAVQRREQIVDFGERCRLQRCHRRIQCLPQLVQQLLREAGEIVDEVQRVLDLVRDACGQLAKRRHLLGVHQVGLRGLQLAIRVLHRPAGFGGGIAGRFQLSFALLRRGDIRPDRHRSAFAGPEFADAKPSSVGEVHLAGARRVAVKGKALLDPRRGFSLRRVISAADAECVDEILEACADDEQVGGIQQLLAAAVEDDEPVVLVPEGKTVGDALDRVGEASPGQLDGSLRSPLLGDVRVDRNEAAARHRVAANLQDRAVGPHPFVDIRAVEKASGA